MSTVFITLLKKFGPHNIFKYSKLHEKELDNMKLLNIAATAIISKFMSLKTGNGFKTFPVFFFSQ